jgi:hypothetical protein
VQRGKNYGHSDFLAFLLDPQQNHGLGDAFLKRLLQKALASAPDTVSSVTPIDLDIWSLDEVFVRREWQNIDILLEDEPHRLVIIIENKISSSEHSNQLCRYYCRVRQQHPDWSIIGLYLTPDGDQPSYDAYLSIDYELICMLLESLAESRASTLGADILTVINHYTQMLRRHIVEKSEIAELCQRIYRKHRKALDLIYEYRPDRQATIRPVLESLIQETPGLVPDSSSKTYVYFAAQEWAGPLLKEGKGWTHSSRILLFSFINGTDSLKINLTIGPGPYEIRKKLFEMAQRPPFQAKRKALTNKWLSIYQQGFLLSQSYQDMSDDELIAEIYKHWAQFIKNDLPAINEAIKAQDWIWQPDAKSLNE